MKKDFDKWSQRKKGLHEDKNRPYFDVREVWFTHFGVNIGYEQDGAGSEFLRPGVVVEKFNNEVCWVLPLSKADKEGKYYFKTGFQGDEESTAILSQLRLVDAKRFKYKAGYIDKDTFAQMKKRLKKLLS